MKFFFLGFAKLLCFILSSFAFDDSILNRIFETPSNLNSKSLVLQLCPAKWEIGFIKELFPDTKFKILNELESSSYIQRYDSQVIGSQDIPRVVIFNFYNAGPNKDYHVVNTSISLFSPAVLVHLSDEFLGMSELHSTQPSIARNFYDKVPLVLRQYGVHIYRSYEHPRSNVMQLPLGYKESMLVSNGQVTSSVDAIQHSALRHSIDRNLTWSFVGSMKRHTRERERQEILKPFKQWGRFEVASVATEVMRDIYNNSKFVLMTRGHANLACFRFFEAMICGAIPVVVGNARDIYGEFEFDGDTPPAVYGETPADALRICQSMSDRDIDEMRLRMMQWYINRMRLIRAKIDLYVRVFPPTIP